MTTIALVSCVKKKRHYACEARELYISPLFQGMREYAENHADEWYILSAKYGLLLPREKIGPYEQTLKTMSAKERKQWAEWVYKQFRKKVGLTTNSETTPHRIMFLAGKAYREHLESYFRGKEFKIIIPMKDMKLGKQLQWLKQENNITSHQQLEGFGFD